MRWFFLFILSFFLSAEGVCKDVPYDSSHVVIRSFDKTSVDDYRKRDEFQYDRVTEPPHSLWDRFWKWFWDLVDQVMKSPGGRVTVYTVFILLGVLGLAFFIWKMMSSNNRLFGSTGQALDYEVSDEDIHNINFEDGINEAVANRNYRLAVRLVYLFALKKLSDRSLIEWKPGKTNSAYIFELRNHNVYMPFNQLTLRFEYAWYGGEDIAEEQYTEVDRLFNEFKTQLA